MNLHPGARAALTRLGSNELGVARMMAAGEITSPQRYMNMTLYALRVTGTGVSYRPSLDEFVYRRPEFYLSEEFLARCAGLPVIWVHPEKSLLDSDEFAKRVVGTVMLPYIKGDEVWAIARLYDDQAIEGLASKQMSTSPAVLLGPSKKYKGEDGSQMIDEGDSTLLDHLAIVTKGVWDKGGEATGVDSGIRGDSAVTDQNKEVEKTGDEGVKSDSEKKGFEAVMDALGGLGKRLDGLGSRMDAYDEEKKADKARKDAEDKKAEDERKAADAKRKDEEGDDPNKIVEGAQNGTLNGGGRSDADDKDKDKEEAAKRLAADKAKKDAEDEENKKADARADALQKRLDDQDETIRKLTARMPKDIDDAEYSTLVGHQARADDVFTKFGERAPRPLNGESPLMYRRRVAGLLQKHSPRWKDMDLNDFKEGAFAQVEGQIYADADESAKRPTGEAGKILEHVRQLPSGHTVTEFFGSDTHFCSAGPFGRSPRRVAGIRTE